MIEDNYAQLPDERLAELLYASEDRLPLEAAQEIAGRDSFLPLLCDLVMDKQSWLSDLPEWWNVVHATYILAMRGGEEAALPLLSALRWADAFDCDWVTEFMPSIMGKLGPPAIPGLTTVCQDRTAGWSARDLALKGLAATSLDHPECKDLVFGVIGQRFMDESEDRVLRQLAGQVLLDFRVQNYRMALLKFAREDWSFKDLDFCYPAGFAPEEVEWSFKRSEPEVWHYQDDWTRFYDPAEIQRRQKRWGKERIGSSQSCRLPGGSQDRVVSIWRGHKRPEAPAAPQDPDANQD